MVEQICQAAGRANFDEQGFGMGALGFLNGAVDVLADQRMNGVIDDNFDHVCTADRRGKTNCQCKQE